jgi:hypothetical protein
MPVNGTIMGIGELARGKGLGRPLQGDFSLELVEIRLLS